MYILEEKNYSTVVTTSFLRLIAILQVNLVEHQQGRNYLISEAHCNSQCVLDERTRSRNYLISEAHCNEIIRSY